MSSRLFKHTKTISMRKITSGLLIAAFCLSFTGIDNKETQVKKAADKGLQPMLALIPQGQETNYGFHSRDDFQKAGTGEIYRTISFTNEFYQDKEISSSKNYIRVQNEWRVPVVVDGNNKTLLTVFGKDTALSVVDLGGSMLAEELQTRTAGFESKEKFILRVYPLGMDFLVFADNGTDLSGAHYFAMNSAKTGIPALSGNSLTQQEVFVAVKKKLASPSEK
jgi:hypothetical protein